MVKIEIINPVESRMTFNDASIADGALSYRYMTWQQGQFSKYHKGKNKYVWLYHDKKYLYFHTGLIDRVTTYLDKVKQKWEILDKLKIHFDTVPPKLAGIELRVDQLKLIKAACQKPQRGVILAPTGTGKTILQAAILSAFGKEVSVLWLAHTSSLVTQTNEEFRRFGHKPQIIGAGYGRSKIKHPLVLSTMQSFVKSLKEKPVLGIYFDMVIIDECHHCGSTEGTYGKILSQILSPIRFGFTATPPETPEAVFALEGLIGPVIGELSINEAADLEIVAHPKIRIAKVPLNYRVSDLRSYNEAYSEGIVYSTTRNKMIVQMTKEYTSLGKSVLIMVNQIAHGEEIQRIGKEERIKIPFVQGKTIGDVREEIKKDLESKEIHCAICTTVWKEGINIPSLDVVINAGGGKSEIPVLQAIGRGLRRTKDKDSLVVVDFFDPSSRYFVEHFGNRISLYCENNWL